MSLEGDGLDALMAQLQSVQTQLAAAKADSARTLLEGSSGNGAVRVEASGEFEFTRVSIDPGLFEAGDVTLLEDLLLAALRDLATRVEAQRNATMGSAVGGLLNDLLGVSDPYVDLEEGEDDLDDGEPEPDGTEDAGPGVQTPGGQGG